MPITSFKIGIAHSESPSNLTCFDSFWIMYSRNTGRTNKLRGGARSAVVADSSSNGADYRRKLVHFRNKINQIFKAGEVITVTVSSPIKLLVRVYVIYVVRVVDSTDIANVLAFK